MKKLVAMALFLAFDATAALVARVPDVAAFDASETLVAIALNGAADGGSSLAIYDATTGSTVSSATFPGRTRGLFFCSSRKLMLWTDTGVVRMDPRTAAPEDVMPLATGERIAVAPGCDSVAIYGPERREVTIYFFGSRRKFAFEASPGTRAACYNGEATAVMMLTTTGVLFEGELQKKRRRTPLAAPMGGEALGIACFGKNGVALGGLQAEVRARADAPSGTRIPLACSLEFHACAVSADGRTVATVSDESGKRLKAVRFHSTSRMKGVATAGLPGEPVSVALSPSGASAVATFPQGPPVLVSRATGSHLKVTPPGARIVE